MAILGIAVAVLGAGLVGGCAPTPDVAPDPNPTSTTVAQDCRTELDEVSPGGAFKPSKELLTKLVQTLNSIRDHCKDPLDEYGSSNIEQVVPEDRTPGVTKLGCMQPAPVDNGRLFRPICFRWVPDAVAQQDHQNASPYYIVRLGDGKGNFAGTDGGAKESSRASLFIWRMSVQKGASTRQYDFMYDGTPGLQALMIRPVPNEGRADAVKLDADVLVWQAVAVVPKDRLRNLGNYADLMKRDNDLGRRLAKSQERYARTILEWDDYNLITRK